MTGDFERVDVRIAEPEVDRAPVSATLRLEGAVKESSDTCRARMFVLAIAFCAAFVVENFCVLHYRAWWA